MERIETFNTFNFRELLKSQFVDLSGIPKKPETVLYIGKDDKGNRVEAMTRGEFSIIVGASKSKKTFFKSLIAAQSMKNTSYSDHIVSLENKGLIIDIDTEQGRYYAYRSFKRVELLTDSINENYKPFELRTLLPEQRLRFINELLESTTEKIDLLLIDGLADLLDDVNDLKKSNELTSYLMRWTSQYNCHVCCVLHRNFGTSKPTGHVGSAILKKAETVIFANKIEDSNGKVIDKNTTKITCEYSRGMWFNDFMMYIDEFGMPHTIDTNADDILF